MNTNLEAIEIPKEDISHFCARWQITELAFFGSVLRDDFRADSDLDILVTFADIAHWGLLEHLQMEQELAAIMGKEVDLISKRAIESSDNWLRRQEILQSAQVFFVDH
jgi:predicted nucleotidyltransferase